MINWRNIQLVKFSDGKYGVRKGCIFHEYKSQYSKYWFSKYYERFEESCTMGLEKAKALYKDIIESKNKPIKSKLKDTVLIDRDNWL